jgi:hypothetical protein
MNNPDTPNIIDRLFDFKVSEESYSALRAVNKVNKILKIEPYYHFGTGELVLKDKEILLMKEISLNFANSLNETRPDIVVKSLVLSDPLTFLAISWLGNPSGYNDASVEVFMRTYFTTNRLITGITSTTNNYFYSITGWLITVENVIA